MRPSRARGQQRRIIRPEAPAIVVRHIIPLVGVFALGWSPLEVVYSLFLDSLSVLARAAGVAAYFTTRSLAHDDQDWADRINLVAGGVGLFAVALALLGFALGVLGFFMWAYILRPVGVEIFDLAADRSLVFAFGAMLVCQLPGFVQFVRVHTDDSARKVVEPEAGFILQRVAVITMLCGFVAALPGEIALGAGVVIIQTALAVSEIARRSTPA